MEPDPDLTIDAMFAAHPEIEERLRAQREADAEISRNLLSDSDEDRVVSAFLHDALGYDPGIIYRQNCGP